jgi:hypothetical protein
MAYVVTGVVLALLVYFIAKAVTTDRYAKMTAEQFEREAQRSSKVGAAAIGFQKVVDPGHRVEYVQERQQQVELESAQPGDTPDAGRLAPLDSQGDSAAHADLQRKIIEEG